MPQTSLADYSSARVKNVTNTSEVTCFISLDTEGKQQKSSLAMAQVQQPNKPASAFVS